MDEMEYIKRIEALRQGLEQIATGKISGGGSCRDALHICKQIAKETLEGDDPELEIELVEA